MAWHGMAWRGIQRNRKERDKIKQHLNEKLRLEFRQECTVLIRRYNTHHTAQLAINVSVRQE